MDRLSLLLSHLSTLESKLVGNALKNVLVARAEMMQARKEVWAVQLLSAMNMLSLGGSFDQRDAAFIIEQLARTDSSFELCRGSEYDDVLAKQAMPNIGERLRACEQNDAAAMQVIYRMKTSIHEESRRMYDELVAGYESAILSCGAKVPRVDMRKAV